MRLSAILLCCALAAATASQAQPRPVLVEYYGDSTVWGYASGSDGRQVARPAPQVFAEALRTRVRVDVRNHGVSGSTACALLEGTDGRHPPWPEQMRASKAQFVILNHAINDQWRHDLEAYRACLRELARTARAHGKQVIFETPNPTRDSGVGGLDTYVAAMKEVALQEGLPVIDQYTFLNDKLRGRSPLLFAPDGLHPSDTVYVMKGMFAAHAFSRLFGL
ncbi:MAG TPA: SGNH/GDSL hydrolase family protein [Noviherbaspirillum sp.]|nr:SGNH/GDSL hydrolase family protein [Noviherbaspirillum sp.]